ncbi:related to phosphatidic acid-preferring phospholipase A1 [Serendipita indica DSM 11827]|uniref:Related to phosphatidic acid-preferring phospholipase A1 n=1 Tax=Serendipita indica (strain DSM 11827) TaxID=1109443 RepID=G4TI55_SERID|nr:related to phosphatidic acid-preferring phospholipase A1 [Serendipita indica DSM 11827]
MSCPEIHVRWWHSSHGVAHLELLATPAAKISTGSWTKLSRDESNGCEAAWRNLSDQERLSSTPINDVIDDEPPLTAVEEIEDDPSIGVAIGKERLFEVDVRTMTMHAVFWKLSGPPIRVRRTIWMYDANRPVDEPLASDLEDAYHTIRPWELSYQEEVTAALQAGAVAYEKLKHPLKHSDGAVFFDDAFTARLIYNSFANKLSSAIFATIRGSKSNSPYPSAPVVYRGYDEAVRRANVPSRPASVSPSRSSTTQLDTSAADRVSRRKSMDVKAASSEARGRKSLDQRNSRTGTPLPDAKVGEGWSEDVTDLILVVHGIGQGLSAQYESYNFLYMVNLMRMVARKQAMSPALNSIMRSHNVQFLPIQWRANLKLDDQESRRRAEDGLDNRFSLADVTLKQHVPMVREMMNDVLIDIPFFMSHHQQKMIESVCRQANRVYSLWCARNPNFAQNGRVHIVAHSLGSPICTHILSSQPTLQPPLLDPSIEIPINQFLFNVSSLFMIGSPLAIFLHINQAQLIARKGRERTMQSPPDEALDRVGVFGCMAVDSLYNIFQLSDPIAYKLNACVDSVRAAELPPIAIPSITGTMLGSFQKGMSKMFDGLFTTTAAPGDTGVNDEEETEFELGGGPNKLQGTRFAALNPHGAIDFYLPPNSTISEYVDMITAHSSYWGDSSLAAFILAEIFARKEDLVRTGLGPQGGQMVVQA